MIQIPRRKKLEIEVKGHKRSGFTKQDGTKVKSTSVKKHKRLIEDRGALGLGKKVIPKVKKGKMTELARKYGYIKENQTIDDIPHYLMDDLTRDLVLREGLSEKSVSGMYQAQIIFRKNDETPKGKEFSNQMRAGQKELQNIPPKRTKKEVKTILEQLQSKGVIQEKVTQDQLNPAKIVSETVQIWNTKQTEMVSLIEKKEARKLIRDGRAIIIKHTKGKSIYLLPQ